MRSIIEVKGLVKEYGDLIAVNKISFAINEGEIFGLLGPNGAGKTTTISILSCLLEPTSGLVIINSLNRNKNTDKIKQIVGIVPQDIVLYPQLSGYDNLMFFGRMYGLGGGKLKQRVREVLNVVGLTERAKDLAKNYSGGMKRRLNLAAGLLHQPKVLFLDEPTVGVDPQSRNYIFENIERFKREDMTILYTTHYMEEAERLCDRIAIIDEGSIIALDSPQDLIKNLGRGVIRIGIGQANDQASIRLIKEIEDLDQVKKVSLIDGKLSVETTNPQEALLSIIVMFNKADVEMSSLEILEPNLENVFLYLTGKHLRD